MTISEEYLKSYSEQPMPETLRLMIEALKKAGFREVSFRWSKNKVPHLVVHRKPGYSVCWFKSTKTYRVFDPYGLLYEQEKHNFETSEQVIKYIKLQG